MVGQVLQLREVNFFNTVVTAQGGIFVQNPTSVLGHEYKTGSSSPTAEGDRSAKTTSPTKRY